DVVISSSNSELILYIIVLCTPAISGASEPGTGVAPTTPAATDMYEQLILHHPSWPPVAPPF
ncbi:hypothetical protein LVK53_28370, partial [Escherichia coli]|nr:hypothetical protein [Escherichia coli]